MAKIGVLALQGSVIEHINMLKGFDGVEVSEVRSAKDLEGLDGIILPGGESTTLSNLLNTFEIMDPLRQKINQGMPVWGTCAGMILLAKEIKGEKSNHLGVMDITVLRNAYGSQIDSFKVRKKVPKVSDKDIELVFIRAPWVEKAKDNANILLSIDDKIVAAEQDNMLATSFHPELTDDLSFHRYFINKVINH